MAHTADDVIDQRVNQCSKIPSVYTVCIFPNHEKGMGEKRSTETKSSKNEKLEPSPGTDETNAASRRIRSCPKREAT